MITTPARPKKPKALVIIGLLLMVAAPIAAIVTAVLVVRSASDKVDGFARFPSDVACQISFSAAGEYVVYEEYVSEIDETSACGEPGPLRHRGGTRGRDHRDRGDRGRPAGHVRETDDVDVSFDFSGRLGEKKGELDVPAPGTYDVTVSPTEPVYVVAIGSSVAGDVGRGVLLAVGIGLGLFLVGLVLLIIGIRRRGRAKRAAVAASAAAPAVAGTPWAAGRPAGRGAADGARSAGTRPRAGTALAARTARAAVGQPGAASAARRSRSGARAAAPAAGRGVHAPAAAPAAAGRLGTALTTVRTAPATGSPAGAPRTAARRGGSGAPRRSARGCAPRSIGPAARPRRTR